MTDKQENAVELADKIEWHINEDSHWLSQSERRMIIAALRSLPAPAGADGAIEWAVSRWEAEVKNRPLQNIHRRSLDTTWRQVIRHFGGDDISLCGLSHDALLEQPAGVKITCAENDPGSAGYVSNATLAERAEFARRVKQDMARPLDLTKHSAHLDTTDRPLGWNTTSNARHEVKVRDYIDKLKSSIASEFEAQVKCGRNDDLYSIGCGIVELPMVASMIEFVVNTLREEVADILGTK